MDLMIDLAKEKELTALLFKHGVFPEQPAHVLLRMAKEYDKLHSSSGSGGSNGAKVNGVVTAVLAAQKASGGSKRAAPGTCTPAAAFQDPIIRVLMKYPHGAGDVPKPYARPAKQVILEVGEEMKSVLNEVDQGKLGDTGMPRWENKCQWARQHLVDEGYLKPRKESGFGVWELSKKGIEYGQKLVSKK